MPAGQGEPEFNQARAELFEALGHPVRIRILQNLEREPMGFAELKKAVGIESSGHFSFHLGKLEGLLKIGQDGNYSLTDEGREALRVISVTRDEGAGNIKVRIPRMASKNTAIVLLVVGLLLVASLAIFQEQQISTLNRTVASQQIGSIIINGTRYSFLDLPMSSLNFPAVIHFNGVAFNITGQTTGGIPFTVAAVNASQRGGPLPRTNQTVSGILRISPSPLFGNVQVKFADGQQEEYRFDWIGVRMSNQTTVFAYNSPTLTVFAFSFPLSANPWFTQHANPRAGVYWNSTTSSIELLVSL